MSNPNLKTVCDNCAANYIVKHDLPEDYIEQFCPFCGEEHENIEEEFTDIDNNWDFQIMNDIFNKVMDGSKIIALHRGKYFQINSGLRIDTGAFIKGLEYATNKDSILIGKPDQSFFKIALKFLNMSRKNVAMVGDDLVNDIQGAKDNNIFSILVKTGKYRENIYKSSSIEADLVINSIYEIPEFFNHLNKIETRKS